jgi:transposase
LNSWFQQKEWRRSQVLELSSKGYNQSDIAKTLQVDKSTVCRDINCLREESKHKIRKYVDERLPEEYEKCLVGITAILKEAWNTARQASDKREKIQALSLAKECYAMKLDLLTNATVVDDAVKFILYNLKMKTIETPKPYVTALNNNTQYDAQRSEKENGSSRSTLTTNTSF